MTNEPYVRLDISGSDEHAVNVVTAVVQTALSTVGFSNVSLEVENPAHSKAQMGMVENMAGQAIDDMLLDNSYEFDSIADIAVNIVR